MQETRCFMPNMDLTLYPGNTSRHNSMNIGRPGLHIGALMWSSQSYQVALIIAIL